MQVVNLLSRLKILKVHYTTLANITFPHNSAYVNIYCTALLQHLSYVRSVDISYYLMSHSSELNSNSLHQCILDIYLHLIKLLQPAIMFKCTVNIISVDFSCK